MTLDIWVLETLWGAVGDVPSSEQKPCQAANALWPLVA